MTIVQRLIIEGISNKYGLRAGERQVRVTLIENIFRRSESEANKKDIRWNPSLRTHEEATHKRMFPHSPSLGPPTVI